MIKFFFFNTRMNFIQSWGMVCWEEITGSPWQEWTLRCQSHSLNHHWVWAQVGTWAVQAEWRWRFSQQEMVSHLCWRVCYRLASRESQDNGACVHCFLPNMRNGSLRDWEPRGSDQPCGCKIGKKQDVGFGPIHGFSMLSVTQAQESRLSLWIECNHHPKLRIKRLGQNIKPGPQLLFVSFKMSKSLVPLWRWWKTTPV